MVYDDWIIYFSYYSGISDPVIFEMSSLIITTRVESSSDSNFKRISFTLYFVKISFSFYHQTFAKLICTSKTKNSIINPYDYLFHTYQVYLILYMIPVFKSIWNRIFFRIVIHDLTVISWISLMKLTSLIAIREKIQYNRLYDIFYTRFLLLFDCVFYGLIFSSSICISRGSHRKLLFVTYCLLCEGNLSIHTFIILSIALIKLSSSFVLEYKYVDSKIIILIRYDWNHLNSSCTWSSLKILKSIFICGRTNDRWVHAIIDSTGYVRLLWESSEEDDKKKSIQRCLK